MANKISSKKRIRTRAKETVVNANRKSRVRTITKKAIASISTATKEEAIIAVRQAESEMMKAASRGTMKKKTASRKVSRLVKKLKEKQN